MERGNEASAGTTATAGLGAAAASTTVGGTTGGSGTSVGPTSGGSGPTQAEEGGGGAVTACSICGTSPLVTLPGGACSYCGMDPPPMQTEHTGVRCPICGEPLAMDDEGNCTTCGVEVPEELRWAMADGWEAQPDGSRTRSYDWGGMGKGERSQIRNPDGSVTETQTHNGVVTTQTFPPDSRPDTLIPRLPRDQS